MFFEILYFCHFLSKNGPRQLKKCVWAQRFQRSLFWRANRKIETPSSQRSSTTKQITPILGGRGTTNLETDKVKFQKLRKIAQTIFDKKNFF